MADPKCFDSEPIFFDSDLDPAPAPAKKNYSDPDPEPNLKMLIKYLIWFFGRVGHAFFLKNARSFNKNAKIATFFWVS